MPHPQVPLPEPHEEAMAISPGTRMESEGFRAKIRFSAGAALM